MLFGGMGIGTIGAAVGSLSVDTFGVVFNTLVFILVPICCISAAIAYPSIGPSLVLTGIFLFFILSGACLALTWLSGNDERFRAGLVAISAVLMSPFYFGLTFITAGLAGLRKRILPKDESRCQTCGYLLVGLPERRCPECGTTWTDEP